MSHPLKKPENDPQKKLENALETPTSRLGGGLPEAFMGNGIADDKNGALDRGQISSGGVRQMQWLTQNGLDATAEVISITDTGTFYNFDPVVMITVRIQPAMIAVAFETTGRTTVSKATFPHAGDRIKIRYNPANPTQFVML